MGVQKVKRLMISNDRISGMPDDILSFTLTLMSMRDAVRTSALSRRWRYLWKSSVTLSSSLDLDYLNMRGSDYSNDMFRVFLGPGGGYREDSSMLATERLKFLKWVDQILQLDLGLVTDSFRLRYYFKKDCAHDIDRWISVAISKRVQNLDINLSHFHSWGMCRANKSFYKFPCGIFTQKMDSLVKSLCLNSCIFEPLDFSCFSSLVHLQLERVRINQENFVTFLSNCTSIENLRLIRCWKLVKLIISGKLRKVKYLTIVQCGGLREIEIEGKSLTRLEYYGPLVEFSFLNVPRISDVIIQLSCKNLSSSLTYVLQNISSRLPKLESLLLVTFPSTFQDILIPCHFAKLKKLVVTINGFNISLWGFIPMLHAAPCLNRLELHWWSLEKYLECPARLMPKKSESPHPCLENIMLGGFTANAHEIEFASYLLNNTAALKVMTIGYNSKHYNYKAGLHYDRAVSLDEKKKMEQRAGQQLMNVVPPGVKLEFF